MSPVRLLGVLSSHLFIDTGSPSRSTTAHPWIALDDPYQSKTGVRTVHIDLHGNPGTARNIPKSKSLTYTFRTTAP